MNVYCVVDFQGNPIDFYLRKSRNHKAAKRMFQKALRSFHISNLRVIKFDKNPVYPIGETWLKKAKKISVEIQIQ